MKYRKKPIIIEAIQWTGFNINEVRQFMKPKYPAMSHEVKPNCLIISNLEGNYYASLGDWIIKGIKGEFYPCKPDIFEETYEHI